MTIKSISFFACYYVATFWLMNYLLKFVSIKMKYVSMSYE
ncbi:putative membrane protein [[Clostridium] sordellii ATCC 9714]|nr:putative membrane protein [[Clostridium] sordellii ATCC 9714] [Paeniclostridium sordellii ATCC 9714]